MHLRSDLEIHVLLHFEFTSGGDLDVLECCELAAIEFVLHVAHDEHQLRQWHPQRFEFSSDFIVHLDHPLYRKLGRSRIP